MRILSVLQPFAQLLVRGVIRYVVRGWDPGYEGQVAIHASGAVPSKADEVAWQANAAIERAFIPQGWSGREDFKRLPFGAVIGSARLVMVYRGIDIREGNTPRRWWAPTIDDHIAAQRYAYRKEVVKPPPPLHPWTIPDDAYVWVFRDPVEFEPIAGVKGMQRLGHVRGDLVDEITAREKAARRRLWRPAPVEAQQVDAARRALLARRRAERLRLIRDVEAAVGRRRVLEALVLRPGAERDFRSRFDRYVARHRAPAGPDGEAMVRLTALPLSLTAGHDVLPVYDLELILRRSVVMAGDGVYASRLAKMRWELLVRIAERGRSEGDDEASVRAALEAAAEASLRAEDDDAERHRRARRRSADDLASWPEARRETQAAEGAATEREREAVRQLFR